MRRLLDWSPPWRCSRPRRRLAAIPAEVEIDPARIAGTTGASPDVRVFKGIPFAAPPVGANRWRPPQPVAEWSGVRPAIEYAARCTQGGPGGPSRPQQPPTSEDCLYLNVWTTAESANDRRPVMVWLYGGGFFGGAGSEPRYAGDGLARKGAVVVTLNYRLGAFGIPGSPRALGGIATDAGRDAAVEQRREQLPKVSGNYGMLDAIAALRWVQRNIAAFGGDPDNVTVFGESAGANLTNALVASPVAAGSLSSRDRAERRLHGTRHGPHGHARARRGGRREGAGGRRLRLDRRRARETRGRRVRGHPRRRSRRRRLSDPRGPVADVHERPTESRRSHDRLEQGRRHVLRASRAHGRAFTSAGETALRRARRRVLEAVPGDRRRTSEPVLSRVVQRRGGVGHADRFADAASAARQHAYVYYFTRVPPTPPDRPSRGATHVAEIPYMFNNLAAGPVPWTDTDRQLADTMSSYWVNFARAGDPNGPGLPAWPAYRDATGKAQVLGDTVATEATNSVPVAATLKFFDSAYQQLLKGGANQ